MAQMITKQEIKAARTASGGFTMEQLAAWGVPWPPPKGWKEVLVAGGYGVPETLRTGAASASASHRARNGDRARPERTKFIPTV